MADMMRPWCKTGRDSWACRLVGRSLPHDRTTDDVPPFCQRHFLGAAPSAPMRLLRPPQRDPEIDTVEFTG
jgi:hypothetical protein